MKMIRSIQKLKFALLLGACAMIAIQNGHAQLFTYQVTVSTAALNSSALSVNGIYALDFQLNYGSGPFGNTATISNVNLGGGSLIGSPFLSGTAAGSVATPSSATLSDDSSDPFNEFTQNFNPGTTLTFDVTLSKNTTINTPDGLIFSILEQNDNNTGYQIPTTQPTGSMDPQNGYNGTDLVDFDIGGDGLVNQQIHVLPYAGANNAEPDNGGTGGDYSGITVSVQAVPEPSAWALLLAGIGALIFAYRRQRQA